MKKSLLGSIRSFSPSRSRPVKVFGASFDEVLERQGPGAKIPAVLLELILYVEANGLDTEGIFRLSGSQAEILLLKKEYDEGRTNVLSKCTSIHTASGLLKMYLRELPEPITLFHNYDSFMDSQDMPDTDDKLQLQKTLIENLPRPNRITMRRILEMLVAVRDYQDVNRMTSNNLAIVFGNNLLRSVENDPARMLLDTPKTNSVVCDMIENFNFIFGDGEEEEEEEEVDLKDSGNAEENGDIVDDNTEEAKKKRTTLTGSLRNFLRRENSSESPSSSPVQNRKKTNGAETMNTEEGNKKMIKNLMQKSVGILFDKNKQLDENLQVSVFWNRSKSTPKERPTPLLEPTVTPKTKELESPSHQSPRTSDPFVTASRRKNEVNDLSYTMPAALLHGALKANPAREDVKLRTTSSFGDMSERRRSRNISEETMEAKLDTAMDRLEKARRTHRRPDRLEDMDTHQLQEEKTAIKRELKAFDHEFQKKHGHMPAKADKEHLRALYTRYRDVKLRMDEEEERQRLNESNVFVSRREEMLDAKVRSKGKMSSPSAPSKGRGSSKTISVSPAVTNDRERQHVRQEHVERQTEEVQNDFTEDPSYKALRYEKRKLQIFLHEYQNEFFQKNNRKVSTREDRQPVWNEYDRYRQVKQLLAQYGDHGE
ncbi:hypothetical protein PROFUN_06784 [Planoprotostelium fungivorum]|uniref:Rho-GAP domain-containing protein n=1 Tax=Planoprotostelium fungivorum TaxID=1890364 RepID=A0A2P6NNN7_9EUKA|nr:hypothetical protein PROFUN_06784 [Planoprotostelium fungivorum]